MIPTSRYLGGPFFARRGTRRAIVLAYWMFLVPVTAFVVGRTFAQPREWFFYVVAAVMVLNLWTLSRVGLKPTGPLPRQPDRQALEFFRGTRETKEILADWAFDEREARERDEVHYRAYRFLRIFGFAWFGALAGCQIAWPTASRWMGPVFLSVLVGTIAGLPQTLVLWNAPDAALGSAEDDGAGVDDQKQVTRGEAR